MITEQIDESEGEACIMQIDESGGEACIIIYTRVRVKPVPSYR